MEGWGHLSAGAASGTSLLSTNLLLQSWEVEDDDEEGLAGSCWRLESVVPAR